MLSVDSCTLCTLSIFPVFLFFGLLSLSIFLTSVLSFPIISFMVVFVVPLLANAVSMFLFSWLTKLFLLESWSRWTKSTSANSSIAKTTKNNDTSKYTPKSFSLVVDGLSDCNKWNWSGENSGIVWVIHYSIAKLWTNTYHFMNKKISQGQKKGH